MGEFFLAMIMVAAGGVLVCLLQAVPMLERISHSLFRLADNSEHALKAMLEPDPDCDCPECCAAFDDKCFDADDIDDELSDSGQFFDPDERDRPRKPPKK